MLLNEKFTLNNGIEIPKIGLGTWMINNKDVVEAVKEAVKLGYRHFDSAQVYFNEQGVGEAIRNCGVPRNELFVTSKVSAGKKGYESAKKSIEESLKKLDIEYLDLMLIHAPRPWVTFNKRKQYDKENLEVWKALIEFYKAGKIKAIGVSNFAERDIQNLIDHSDVKPAVNQILAHVGNTPFKLIKYCKDNDIIVESYSPMAHGKAVKNKDLLNIANKYQVSVPQICIRYVLQLDTIALPKSSNPNHMKDNAAVDFVIDNDDMEKLKRINSIKYGLVKLFPAYKRKEVI